MLRLWHLVALRDLLCDAYWSTLMQSLVFIVKSVLCLTLTCKMTTITYYGSPHPALWLFLFAWSGGCSWSWFPIPYCFLHQCPHQRSHSHGTPGDADLWWGPQGSHGECEARDNSDTQRCLQIGKEHFYFRQIFTALSAIHSKTMAAFQFTHYQYYIIYNIRYRGYYVQQKWLYIQMQSYLHVWVLKYMYTHTHANKWK